MRVHELKIEKVHLESLLDGSKKLEIRLNDRDYQKGDWLWFKYRDNIEGFNNGSWFNNPSKFEITHVLDLPKGLKKGYVALSLKKISGDNISIT